MTRSQFFQHFDLLADQPDAVAKMRELVLQLAIQGRLLASERKDKSARDLAARIRAAKKSSFPPISQEEVPFALPPTWEWVRVGEAMNLINGRAFKPTDWSAEGLPIVRIQNLNNPDAPYNYCNFEVDAKVLLRAGDFLISWSGTPGTSFGAFIWNRGKAVLNQHIFRAELLGDAYTKEFLRLAVNGRLEEMIANAHGAVGLQHITKGKLELLVLPLPPLAEQRRIVAKVEELMALCDELAARQQARHAARAQLQQSALHHLLAARDPHTFAPAWQRVRDHFHLLHDTPDALPQLRQAILQLAVQGRLAKDSETWARKPRQLGEVAPMQNGYAFKSEWFTPNGIRLLRNANVGHDELRWDDTECIEKSRAKEFERFALAVGDVVLSLDRPFISTGTKVARIRETDLPCLLLQRVGRFQPDLRQIHPDYLFLWLNSPRFTSQIDPGRSNGVPHISSKQVEAAEIFVPPLAEQKRIVARVEALLRQCDALAAQWHQTRTLGAHLLDATLHHLLAA